MQKPISLLEYALSESKIKDTMIKRRNLIIETFSTNNDQIKQSQSNQSDLELMIDSNSNGKQFVSIDLFKMIITHFEERIQELEQRLDNRENFQNLTQKYSNEKKIQKSFIDNSNQDEADESHLIQKSRKHNNSIAKNLEIKDNKNEEPLISRLNIFEKRIYNTEEKQTKIIKEVDNFKKDIESQIQECLKQLDWNLEKFNKFSKELLTKVENVIENHKEIFEHLHKNKDDINFVRITSDHYHQICQTQTMQLSESIETLNSYMLKHEPDYESYKQLIYQSEQDIFQLVQMYRDILKIIYDKNRFKENNNEQ